VRDGAEEARDIVESYELGGNRYVVKPGDFEQFARRLYLRGNLLLRLAA